MDVGIAEQHAVTYAAGIAARGLRPVVAIYSSFLQRAYDQIAHDVCIGRLPVIFAIDRAGLVGDDGKTHHGVFDIAYLRHLPGMTIFMPRDGAAIRRVLRYALAHEAPCAIRYPRGVAHCAATAPLPPSAQENPERWETLAAGADVALIAIGPMVSHAWHAAELLKQRGIAAAVVDACAIQPLDTETLRGLAGSCGRLATIEDHVLSCGLGSAVAEWLAGTGQRVPLLRLGIPDVFVTHGTIAELHAQLGLQPEQLAQRVAEWIAGGG